MSSAGSVVTVTIVLAVAIVIKGDLQQILGC